MSQTFAHSHTGKLVQEALYTPSSFVEKICEGSILVWLPTLVFGLGCYALFGMSLGFFPRGPGLITGTMLFPLVFFGALLIGVPTLYIFHSFLGSQLNLRQFLAIGLVGLLLPGILLAGFAPINWFLALSTKSAFLAKAGQYQAIALASFFGYREIFELLKTFEPEHSAMQQTLMRFWCLLHIGILLKLTHLLT